MSQAARELATLQTALAAEHAAIYGYGVVGAHGSGADRDLAITAYDDHRRQRDLLIETINRTGADPAVAAPAYRLPFEVTSRLRARQLAAHLEEGLCQAYAAIVDAATTTDQRIAAARVMATATERRTRWGGTLTAFPGHSAASR